jgi:hypothetical protein
MTASRLVLAPVLFRRSAPAARFSSASLTSPVQTPENFFRGAGR